MIRVVILEDEMLVRLGLKACLEADRAITVTETFATAEEAETYFKSQSADVLLTDIRLPGISGLELLQRIKPAHPDMKVIVLTCYEDFNYARKALEVGASRYVLKHELDEKELCGMIRECAGSLKDENRPRPQRSWDPGLEKLCEKGARIMLFVFRGTGESTNATAEELNQEMIAELLNSSLTEHGLGRCLIWQGNTMLGVLPEGTELSARLLLWFREISDSLRLYTDKNCYAGVSNLFYGVKNLPEAVSQASGRIKWSFYYEKSTLFLSEPQNSGNKPCTGLVFHKTDAFTEQWLKELQEQTELFFRNSRNSQLKEDEIKENIVRFLHTMLDYGEQYYGFKPEEIYPADALPDSRLVNRFDSLEALEKWFAEVLNRTVRYVGRRESLTAKIRLYIEAHYSDPGLCQSDIAEYFHMSNPYFSQYFKEHFGVNYTQFLNEFRLEQAKILLRNTDESTEAVAEKVGIDNVNYFFRLFKKMEGMTIMQYRKEKRE